MFACICRAVTCDQVTAAIDDGAATLKAVAKATRACTSCGTCRERIANMLAERRLACVLEAVSTEMAPTEMAPMETVPAAIAPAGIARAEVALAETLATVSTEAATVAAVSTKAPSPGTLGTQLMSTQSLATRALSAA